MKRISRRRVLVRAVAFISTAGATALAVSGALLAAPAIADANSVHVCAVGQTDDCIDAANLNEDTPVIGGFPGRDIVIQSVIGGDQVELQFALHDQTMCVAAQNDGVKVDVKLCEGSEGVVWYQTPDPKNPTLFRLESREFAGSYLTGIGNGFQFIIEPGTPIQDFSE
jgi:hypothetical protein